MTGCLVSFKKVIYFRHLISSKLFNESVPNTSALVGVENTENNPPRSRGHGKMSKPLNTDTAHDDNDTAHDGSITVIENKEKKMKTSSNFTIHIYLRLHKCDILFRPVVGSNIFKYYFLLFRNDINK